MGSKESAFGAFVLDRERQMLLRGGEIVAIGQRGFLLLEALLDAAGETVTKEELLERAWEGLIVEEANLAVQIGVLRKALGGDGDSLIVTVPRKGYRLVRTPLVRPEVAKPAISASIAVLPFANLSADAAQEYFADGVVDEIITALSRFRSFAVVARTSSFVYKSKLVDVRQVGRELGVRYVLEGSVRRDGDHLRVTSQLIDSETGANLWADRFDGTAAGIFAFQDSITESVLGLIEPTIRKAEIERARRKPPQSLEAYDLFLKSVPLIYSMDKDDYVAALALLEQAQVLDPNYAVALAYGAWAIEKLAALSYIGEDEARRRAVPMARAALERGRDDPLVMVICGWVLLSIAPPDMGGFDMVRRGLVQNPNNLVVLNLGGTTNFLAGDLDAAFACYSRAYKLSPGAPDTFWSLTGLGWVETERGDDAAALKWFEQSLATSNDWVLTRLGIVASLALAGRAEEAARAKAELLTAAPQLSMESGTYWWKAGPWRRTREGLRRAGFPETASI